MDRSVWMLVFVALLVSGSAQVFMAIELRRMRLRLSRDNPDRVPMHTSDQSPMHSGVLGSRSGYAIYIYREGRWVLEADLSAAGYEPSTPSLEGAYEGQVIKKESVPAAGH